MKAATLLAALSMLAAAPAFATSTIHCTSPDRARLGFYLSVGTGPGAAIASAHMFDGDAEFTTGLNPASPVIAQSWLDDRDLRLDIVDSNAEHHVARLIARKARRDIYVGTLRYRERIWRMRCSWED